ncbi:D-lactate dehydrogenase [Rickettsiales bacterium LUAb2]
MAVVTHNNYKLNELQIAGLISDLAQITGKGYILTQKQQVKRYITGFRFGSGKVLAVVKPANLFEQWQVLQKCIDYNIIIIPQAANTGLTGGSTPDGEDYDRDIVIINNTRINKIHLIDQGKQVVCFGGATLDQLEKTLAPLGREPHSVIGSSCIGASVIGGVCNNSGGALIRRGPAYTELTVFAKVNNNGELELVNHIGINLGNTPQEILTNLESGNFNSQDIIYNEKKASDHNYINHVKDINASTPARYNADTRRLYEASGSAGKVMVFAVRLDTFVAETDTQVFYIGTNNTEDLTEIRKDMLCNFKKLPIAGEYMHRDAFNLTEKYGKDTFILINLIGTKNFPKLFNIKSKFDAFFERFRFPIKYLSDRVLQFLSYFFPNHLPEKLKQYRDKFEHYLTLRVSKDMEQDCLKYLNDFFQNKHGSFFHCTKEEGNKAFLHRFAAAGAATRYRNVHQKLAEDIVALDIALPRNTDFWFETLPQEINESIIQKIYYGHFFCYVFHQDYIVKKGVNCIKLEHKMWEILDKRKAEYPAEHNVGHLYYAKPSLANFYKELDPNNSFNPGIGKTSKLLHYK